MKKIFILISMIALSTAAYAEGPEGWTAPKQSAELQRMKALEGDWTVTEKTADGGSKTQTIQYKVTSGGTAVTETIDPGTAHEMITVYHDKAGKLTLNHYCMLGNQPEMELVSSTDTKMDLQESAASKSLLNGQLRMSSLIIEQPDATTLIETWGGTNADGSAGQPMVFKLKKA
jgi:hypothetical protein